MNLHRHFHAPDERRSKSCIWSVQLARTIMSVLSLLKKELPFNKNVVSSILTTQASYSISQVALYAGIHYADTHFCTNRSIGYENDSTFSRHQFFKVYGRTLNLGDKGSHRLLKVPQVMFLRLPSFPWNWFWWSYLISIKYAQWCTKLMLVKKLGHGGKRYILHIKFMVASKTFG